MSGPRYNRRRLLGVFTLGAAGIAAGAATRRAGQADRAAVASPPPETSSTTSAPPSSTTAPSTTPPSTTTMPELPGFEPYRTVEGEVFADAKAVASRVVEMLTTYDMDEPAESIAQRVTADAVDGTDPDLIAARAADLVIGSAASIGRVLYPQLGGLDPHRAPVSCSVMAVFEQVMMDTNGDQRRWTRCIDVRLRMLDGRWRLVGLEDASRRPIDRPADVSGIAGRVLDHPGIELPDSARWDIHERAVDERVLFELATLADRVPVAVTSFHRGHPVHVFGTDRVSAHTVGRAVDIWRIGDRPVVQQSTDPSSIAHIVARTIFDEGGISNLGAPWAFDGAGGRSFTDPVHHDHLHLGVSA